ncbi:hypothetical protein BBJ28_00012198 [Nothophytophthora sp. Chile5]|nr:hypothetical protein BBJ28_00012198 [Nothophytophthora sp. Chile5]
MQDKPHSSSGSVQLKLPRTQQLLPSTMTQRFSGSSPSGNSNNYLSERSSTRLCKPPGGGSTVGSLIFGGGGGNEPSYLDERKSRRFNPQRAEAPEHGGNNHSNNDLKTPDMGGAAEVSFYAKATAAQNQRDRLTVAPGAVSRETLSQQQQSSALAVVRRGNHSAASSDYFAGGMGSQEGEDQQRRTRRMYAAPGGSSSFKLG